MHRARNTVIWPYGDILESNRVLSVFILDSRTTRNMTLEKETGEFPLDTRRCCDFESTSMTLIQRRNNVVCQWVAHVECVVEFHGHSIIREIRYRPTMN